MRPAVVGPEGTRGIAFGFLGGTRVIDHVIFEIPGKALSGIQVFFQPGVGDVARYDKGPGSGTTGWPPDIPRNSERTSAIGRFRSMVTTRWSRSRFRHVREVLRGIRFELFEKDAVFGNLAQDLPVGRTGDPQPDGAGRAVTRGGE